MNIYTVSFFGHREIIDHSKIEKRLEYLLRELITKTEYIEFLIGRDGDFDRLASSVIKKSIRSYGCGNTSFVLVLPYMRSDFRDNMKGFLDFYDEIEICRESSEAHYKSAIQIRNKKIIDRSDLVICCIQHKNGGAYESIYYAEKQGKKIVNLAENSFEFRGIY